MTKIAFLVALGLLAGFATTLFNEAAHACSCKGPDSWTLTLIEASPEVDRAMWADAVFLTRIDERHHTLSGWAGDMSTRFELDLEVR